MESQISYVVVGAWVKRGLKNIVTVTRPLEKAKKNVDVYEIDYLKISNFRCKKKEGRISGKVSILNNVLRKFLQSPHQRILSVFILKFEIFW